MHTVHRRYIAVTAMVLAGALPSPIVTAQEPTEAWRVKRRAELTAPERLFARGGPRIHRAEHLGAIRLPVGGVGTGAIHMDGHGRRVAWQLWRNFTEFTLPHSGNPFGDDCAGKFYVRALSVWSMLLACQGQIFDGPRGILGFDPAWQPEDHVSFFTTATGWGRFSQQRDGTRQHERIELDWGTLRLRQLVFALPEEAQPAKVSVRAAGKVIETTQAVNGQRVHIALASGTTLRVGETLEVTIDVDIRRPGATPTR